MLATLLFLDPAAQAGPLEAVVGVHARIPAGARTAEVLGTEREGSGVVIGADGLVLTIGYLIMEAESAQILLPEGLALPAEVVAYDYDSGFGLLKPLGALEGPAQAAGLAAEDLILAVKGEPVASQADFYRKVWALGEAGVTVPLTVLRGAELTEVSVTSGDRYDYLKLDPSY